MGPEVIIDPGHGGTHAYGGSSPTGVQPQPGIEEKHVNLELARRVAARLGSVAQLTRTGDVNVPLRERAEMAARAGARVLVSIHSNSGAQGLRGSEVWVHDRHDANSAELAQSIYGSLDRAGPTRGMYRGPLAVLDPAAVGSAAACLIEADYLSDPQGRSRLTSARGLDDLAEAISSGVRSYLGRSHAAQPAYGRVAPRRRDYDAYESEAYHPRGGGYGDGMSYEYTVPGTVPIMRQPNGMACWATVTTMMMGWRNGQSMAIGDALQSIGDEWFRLFDGGRGLRGADKQRFLDQAGLTAMPPSNFGGIAWRNLLEEFGPLWVTGDVDSSEDFAIHARIMYSIRGDGSRDGTWVGLIDPGSGTETELTLGQFMDQYESEAATPGVPLRIQVVHWPAGAQRTSSQGYAPRGRSRALQSAITVREVGSPGQLQPIFRNDQNIGFSAYIGHVSRRDYNNHFVLMTWAQGESVDVELDVEMFDRDPREAGATSLHRHSRRISLAPGGQQLGLEYTHMPAEVDSIYFRITYVEYSQHQRSGEYLWMNVYG